MNVMNVCVQLGEGQAYSNTVTNASNANAYLGSKHWGPGTDPASADVKKSYIDSVTSTSSSSHTVSSGADVSRRLSASGRVRLQSSFPTENDEDEEELHNDVFSNVVKVGGAKRSQAHDLINGGSSVMPEIPNEMPGLSIITWEEFVAEPSLLHNLFSVDKDEFITFDNTLVNNLFHDSRMEPPILGSPADDGLSWHIFVDSYSQLRHVREVMTSRISVLLVDLVKPHDEGTASCIVAINPMNDQIRRVLHLTLSKAMESVFADRCFSVEIDLNKDIATWCRMVLQADCEVVGGRVVITNGETPQACCLVDNPTHCVLCFPLWAYRRIKYMLYRRRRYDDTIVEFEGANFVLCTKSESLRQYSEAAQLTNGERLIHKNSKSITMATQTLNTSCTSLKSDLSVEDVDDVSDNDVIKKRHDVAPHQRGSDSYSGYDNPTFDNDPDIEGKITYTPQNDDVMNDNSNNNNNNNDSIDNPRASQKPQPRQRTSLQQRQDESIQMRSPKSKNVNFTQEHRCVVNDELDIVASANSADNIGYDTNNKPIINEEDLIRNDPPIFYEDGRNQKEFSEEEMDEDEEVLTPRTKKEFLARPYTPFVRKFKEPKVKVKYDKIKTLGLQQQQQRDERSQTPVPPHTNSEVVMNEKIAKRQKTISSLLKDLVSSSNTSDSSHSESVDGIYYHNSVSGNSQNKDNKNEPKGHVRYDSSGSGSPSSIKDEFPVPTRRKVRHTPLKDVQLTPRDNPVFPYTSELLDFQQDDNIRTKLEKYGAKIKSKKGKNLTRTDDMLFKPRLLNLDDIEPDRNCFSDQDIGFSDSDVTDLENDFEGTMSDTEGMYSSRFIPVQTTPRTQSYDHVNRVESYTSDSNNTKSDLDSDLEITDCETEDDKKCGHYLNSPRILPGAKAAHQLRSASAHARGSRTSSTSNSRAHSAGNRGGSAGHLRSLDYIPPTAQVNRRGGNQNDSRRRYLALNSLRRKAYKLALQSQVRSQQQKRPGSAELLSYNSRENRSGLVTIMSAV